MTAQRDAHQPVTIVGAGPVGLSLAVALARQGVRTTVLEKESGTSEYSKAPAIHVRTREAFRQWGIDERFLEAGMLRRTVTLYDPADERALFSLDFGQLDAEAHRPGLLILEQGETERLLLDAVHEAGMSEVHFDTAAVDVRAGTDEAEVIAHTNGRERRFRSEFVVGCDGSSSLVRDAIGQPFAGTTYELRPMLADVAIDDDRDTLRWPRTSNGRGGITTTVRIRPNLWRVIWLHVGRDAPDDVTDVEVTDRATEVLGPGPVDIVWASRFRIHRRSSPRFRLGRVLLAGDAAHVHSPVGGLGMNAGIQDAHNLAWKLAYALRGGDVDRLLDSYEVERQAVVVESVSRITDLITKTFLQTPARIRSGLFSGARFALAIPAVRRQVPRTAAMLDLDYPPSPLLRRGDTAAGARLPNVVVRADGRGGIRLHDLLGYEPALIDTSGRPEVAAAAPVGRVIRLDADGTDEATRRLRRLTGHRPGWTLVRPDGHIAWSIDHPDRLADAIAHALGGRAAR